MMDEFDEGVEPGSGENGGSKLAMVALFIGIVGIVVGVTGIILANQAQKTVKTLNAELAAQPDKTPELEKAVSDLNERLERLGGEFVKLGRQDRTLQENTQKAFESVQRNIRDNREGINELTGKLKELVERLENWNPPTVRSQPQPSGPTEAAETGEENAPAAAVPEDGVHVIRSGDTLSKIAKEYGVTLSELQRANPTVNPRSLQIGQKIVIPEP